MTNKGYELDLSLVWHLLSEEDKQKLGQMILESGDKK